MSRNDRAVVAASVLASVGTVLLLRRWLRGPRGFEGVAGQSVDKYVFDEHNWPEFTVEACVHDPDSQIVQVQIMLVCSDCGWTKRYPWPVQWSVLTTATVRHGMSHQEQEHR